MDGRKTKAKVINRADHKRQRKKLRSADAQAGANQPFDSQLKTVLNYTGPGFSKDG